MKNFNILISREKALGYCFKKDYFKVLIFTVVKNIFKKKDKHI